MSLPLPAQDLGALAVIGLLFVVGLAAAYGVLSGKGRQGSDY